LRPANEGGRRGYAICRVGKRAFIPDEVLTALAFGDDKLAGCLSFRELMETFTRQLNALSETPDWDRDKKRRLKEELSNLFARGCASWYEAGRKK